MPKPKHVFINCPFTPEYDCHFKAILYVLIRSGFTPRCAREEDDSSDVRYAKICRIIEDCEGGVHDISFTDLYGDGGIDADFPLPRFNMPFELGLFFGAKNFGEESQKTKKTIIFDRSEHRFRKFLSDISGSDITAHASDIANLVKKLAGWLRRMERTPNIPGGTIMLEEFNILMSLMPEICKNIQLSIDELEYNDIVAIYVEYIRQNFALDNSK